MSQVDGEVTPETEQVADDDFNAGFDNAPDATPTPHEDAVVEPAAEAAPAPEAPKYAQITEEQYQDLLAKADAVDAAKAENKRLLDTAFGQIGGLKQRIEQMQSATPAGQPLTLDEKSFSRIAKEFPEFAGELREDFKELLGNMKGTASAADPAAIEKMVEDRVAARTAALRQEQIDTTLEDINPEWRAEVASPMFAQWIGAQPEDVKALAGSDRISDAKRMLRLYEQSKARPAPKPENKPSTRQRQIEAAVAPKGVGGHSAGPTDDDEFMAGFKSNSS
jgi:hypothetical protein